MSVSRILRDPENPRFSRQTRKLVLNMAHAMGYVRNRQAESLRSGQSGLAGLLLPWNIPELLDEMVHGMAAAQRGLLTQISPDIASDGDDPALRLLIEHRVDTLIWMPSHSASASQIDLLRCHNIRTILLESFTHAPPVFPVIDFDYLQGFRDSLHHAAQTGYRRVDFLHDQMEERLQVRASLAAKAAAENGLEFHDVLLENIAGAKAHLNSVSSETLLLCDHDWIGLELASASPRAGIMILGDLLIGGSHRVGEIPTLPLTAIQRDFSAMAKQAIELANAPEEPVPKYYTIPMKLVFRTSTGKK